MKKLLISILMFAVMIAGVNASLVGDISWQDKPVTQTTFTIADSGTATIEAEIAKNNGEQNIKVWYVVDDDIERSQSLYVSRKETINFGSDYNVKKLLTIIPEDYGNKPGTYYIHVNTQGSNGFKESLATLILIVKEQCSVDEFEFSCWKDNFFYCTDIDNDGYGEIIQNQCPSGFECIDPMIGWNGIKLPCKPVDESVCPNGQHEVSYDGETRCLNDCSEENSITCNNDNSYSVCYDYDNDGTYEEVKGQCSSDEFCNDFDNLTYGEDVMSQWVGPYVGGILKWAVLSAAWNQSDAACFDKPYCGDKIQQWNEECDVNAGAPENGYCTSTCQDVCNQGYHLVGAQCVKDTVNPVCGNDVVEAGEQCDNNNIQNGVCDMTAPDACTIECNNNYGYDGTSCIPSPANCGNGVLNSNEQCDDGNRVNGDGCSGICRNEQGYNPVCSDDIIQIGEQCDDGNSQNNDGCSSICRIESDNPVCGNNVCELGENANNCPQDCSDAVCGNNVVEYGESCEGSGSVSCIINGYAGTSSCNPNTCEYNSCIASEYCGDGIRNGAEVCDGNSNTPANATCNSQCSNFVCDSGYQRQGNLCVLIIVPVCGDNIINQIFEECDGSAGAPQNGSCSLSCNIQCNLGYTRIGNACIDSSVLVCGDGNIDANEQCDDANTQNGDGCSSTCQITFECNDGVDNDGDNAIDFPNDLGCDNATDNDERSNDTQVTRFLINAIPSEGFAPLNVLFSLVIINPQGPYTFLWTFDDNRETSNLQNPNHVYTKPGIYYPSLRVFRNGVEVFYGSLRIVVKNPTSSAPRENIMIKTIRENGLEYDFVKPGQTIDVELNLANIGDFDFDRTQIRATIMGHNGAYESKINAFEGFDAKDNTRRAVTVEVPKDLVPGVYDLRINVETETGIKRIRHREFRVIGA